MIGKPAEMLESVFEMANVGKFHEALSACDYALLNRPGDVMAHYGKFMVLGMMGDHGTARKCLNRAIQIEPELAFLYVVRAYDAMGRKEIRKALADLENAEECDGDGAFEPVIPLLKADCYLQLGDHEAARQECDHIPDDFSYPGYSVTSRAGIMARLDRPV